MSIDDHPIDALRHHIELEDSSRSMITKAVIELAASMNLPWPLGAAVNKLREHIAADEKRRIEAMLDPCATEVLKMSGEIDRIRRELSEQESSDRSEVMKDLLFDAARKASMTRSLERVQRIGIILSKGVTERRAAAADEVEEMMRVAMELSDSDVEYLRELVRIEGSQVKSQGRIERYTAHTLWEQGFWNARPDGTLDSIFSKLESYGLVSRIPPSNNLNIMADFQNRYVLQHKGLRFVEFATAKLPLA